MTVHMHASSCNMLRLSKDFPRRLPRQVFLWFLRHLHTFSNIHVFLLPDTIWSWGQHQFAAPTFIWHQRSSNRRTGEGLIAVPQITRHQQTANCWPRLKHLCSQSILQRIEIADQDYVTCPILEAPGQIELVILSALLSLTNKSLALGSAL